MGRKANFSVRERNQCKAKALEILESKPIILVACQKIGISRQTFYQWQLKDKAFSQDVKKALAIGQGSINDLAESRLIGLVSESDKWAIGTWLKHNHPNYKKGSQNDEPSPIEEESIILYIPDNRRMDGFDKRNENNQKTNKKVLYKSIAGQSYLKNNKS